jgi:hypothetical protein
MLKRVLIVLAIAGIVYWIVRDQPTVSGFVDRLTSPLLGSKAAVKESEHNRVVGEAVPAITDDDEKKVGVIKEGMRGSEIRELLGEPDLNEPVVQDGVKRQKWTYRRIHRVLYMEEGRVANIVIQ